MKLPLHSACAPSGQLTNIAYSDSTPAVAFAYDLIRDPKWPHGKINLDYIKKMLDVVDNWIERVDDYLDACPKGKNDQGHFDKLVQKCDTAEIYLRRLRNALDNPRLPNRELVENMRDLLQNMYDNFCPPKDQLPLPVPQPEPVPVECQKCPDAVNEAGKKGAMTIIIFIIWQLLRLYPARNLIPA